MVYSHIVNEHHVEPSVVQARPEVKIFRVQRKTFVEATHIVEGESRHHEKCPGSEAKARRRGRPTARSFRRANHRRRTLPQVATSDDADFSYELRRVISGAHHAIGCPQDRGNRAG